MSVRAIVALDVPSLEACRPIVHALGESADFYKVGGELFTAGGPRVIELLRGAGKEVFLDLKLHDIPTTVRNAARSAAALGVRLITVHAAGGSEMLEAAVEGAGEKCGVLAVTVLTSLSAAGLERVWGRRVYDVRAEVLRLASLAHAAGVHGIVCSGDEAAVVRGQFGDGLKLLIPGIRLPGSVVHDQARVVTPRAAAEAGASYIVLGRTVLGADDPKAALLEAVSALS